MTRGKKFALELVLAIAAVLIVGWVADRFSRKYNRQAQAAERAAGALERMADAAERISPPPAPTNLPETPSVIRIGPGTTCRKVGGDPRSVHFLCGTDEFNERSGF